MPTRVPSLQMQIRKASLVLLALSGVEALRLATPLRPGAASSPSMYQRRLVRRFEGGAPEAMGAASTEIASAQVGQVGLAGEDGAVALSPNSKLEPLRGPLKWGRVGTAVGLQAALTIVVAAVAWKVSSDPWFSLGQHPARDVLNWRVLGWGCLAAAPVAAFNVGLDKLASTFKGPVFDQIEKVGNATKGTVLMVLGSERSFWPACLGALLLSLAAGIGEEAIFRGVLQEALELKLGSPALALFLASAVFGLLHAVTPVYALLAGLAGLYFGWLYTASGHCIFVPAVAHALYDFCALVAAHLEVTALTPAAQLDILAAAAPPTKGPTKGPLIKGGSAE